MPETIVVALGGNALQKPGLPADAQNQLLVVRDTAKQLLEMIKAGKRLAIVHGNGPQVGRIMLQNEAGAALTPAMPFDVCGAMSQGMIGYHIQQALGDEMMKAGFQSRPVTLISQVAVDPDDPAFSHPTKPIGPFYSQAEAEELMKDKGFVFREDAGRGWRRVVASPMPLELVELPHVQSLLDNGFVPVAAGGGGIPVIRTREGGLQGIAAVIDKDLAAWRLAEGLRADTLLILTEVENASLHYSSPEQSPVRRVHAPQLRAWMDEGHFAAGSMGPKVDAALRFVEGYPCRRAIITRLDLALEGLEGSRGTEIIA
jgi:carbamate kinase